MRELRGLRAVVTGGGGGIGRGMALAFARAGMDVVLADVDEAAAAAVAEELARLGVATRAHACDVSKLESVQALADAVFADGEVHLLCNNAGVHTLRAMHELSIEDWRWVLGVNLDGVVHGLHCFLPRMIAQPGESHVVNTASVAGLYPHAALGPYVASKYAVVGLTESLRLEGAAHDLSATALCPGNVRTGIADSGRNRPAEYGGVEPAHPAVAATIEAGMDPEAVGERVREAVERDEAYVVTHPETRKAVADRMQALLAACDRAVGG